MRLNGVLPEHRAISSAMLLILVAGFLSAAPPPSAFKGSNPTSIDIERSTVTVHVYRSGLLSFASDNHEIRAPITSGTLHETQNTVEFVIDTHNMQVLDPKLSADKRSQVQEKMLGPEVLDASRFPEITFRSTRVEQQKDNNQLSVAGELTLHGHTRSISVRVVKTPSHYRGSARLKQTEFGIKPISVGAGTVKVKDEVEVEFDVTTRPQ